jgi:hypothetical protein
MHSPSRFLGIGHVAILATMVLAFTAGLAQAAGVRGWTIQERTGHVQLVKSGISPIALTVGDQLAAGDWIETGPDGRAVLTRGEEHIVVAPDSRIGLPRENTGAFKTRILQTLGTILLTVQKQANQHFEVQTPQLAAVVKGTTFTVAVRGQRTAVHVVEGLVEVSDLASGLHNMVRPGQTGSVLSGGRGVTVQDGSRGASGAPAAPAGSAQSAAANANAGGHAVASDAVVIREALGPVDVDLSNTTGGLMREAHAGPKSIDDRGAAADNPDLRGNSVAARSENGSLANVGGGNGLALGNSVTGSSVADVASAGAAGGTAAGLNGLSKGVGAAVTPPGLSGSAAAAAVIALNQGNGNGHGNGNGNGNGKGNGKGNN